MEEVLGKWQKPLIFLAFKGPYRKVPVPPGPDFVFRRAFSAFLFDPAPAWISVLQSSQYLLLKSFLLIRKNLWLQR
ncbi:hypothetical protein, partial [Hungatella hathewayi]|uniref:hypothetical protein n=1 Tax=Hungatella hathewayi TaxID=154046 RepID=UPI001A99ACA9